jgi:hypothetical protein
VVERWGGGAGWEERWGGEWSGGEGSGVEGSGEEWGACGNVVERKEGGRKGERREERGERREERGKRREERGRRARRGEES